MRSMELVGKERMEVAVSIPTDRIVNPLTVSSLNCLSGVKAVMMTFPMLPISLVCSFMKSASSKINLLTDTTNTV